MTRTDTAPLIPLSAAAAATVTALLALNLRPTVTSVGSVLPEIELTIGMSAAQGAAVVAAPVWCFAAGGPLAWAMHRRWGTGNTIATALLVLMGSLMLRVWSGPVVLIAGTILACLAIAVLSVILPVIVGTAPPHHRATLTACHTTALAAGSALGALLTPQLAAALSLRAGAAAWALLAGAAWLAWQVFPHRGRHHQAPAGARRPAHPLRLTPATTAWSLTVHFGMLFGLTFSLMGWLPVILRERSGTSHDTTQWLFTLAMALGVPLAWVVAKLARRVADQSPLALALAIPSLAGIAGLLLAPAIVPWLWATCIGVGMVAVVLAFALISLRADRNSTASLSSLVHSVGFLIAGGVAYGFGWLYSHTGAWDLPLAALLVALSGQIISGVAAGLPRTVACRTGA